MNDNPNIPYRCPLCLNPVSDCLSDALTGKKVCGCMTCNCDAPHFTQGANDSIFIPRIKWDHWVIAYRNEHPNWHREVICKGCEFENTSCSFYNADAINCPSWKAVSTEGRS